MTLGLMQPYFLPYIGYFQLLNKVDEFVVYDNVEYTKQSWINRNRFLLNGKDAYFTIPVKSDSDFLDVKDRELADNFKKMAGKSLRRMEAAYRDAPYFREGHSLLKESFSYEERNLFRFVFQSIKVVTSYLGIDTPLIISSDLDVNPDLKAADRILATCRERGATTYINPIGGRALYRKDWFAEHGIILQFLKTADVEYPQFDHPFIPHLSIVDVVMFNGFDHTRDLLDNYELL